MSRWFHLGRLSIAWLRHDWPTLTVGPPPGGWTIKIVWLAKRNEP